MVEQLNGRDSVASEMTLSLEMDQGERMGWSKDTRTGWKETEKTGGREKEDNW